ncbi:MAG: hypothetical protein KAS30_01690 [Candidatus Diapherotrites archaeon]|nr:hypothetical protein [Candidatus Diapherotrites archaeon]
MKDLLDVMFKIMTALLLIVLTFIACFLAVELLAPVWEDSVTKEILINIMNKGK